jgi:hypothetical protein
MDDDWYGGCLLDRGAAEEARGRRRQESMKQQRTSKAFFLEVNSITAAATNTVQSKDEVETSLLIEWLYRSFNSKKKRRKRLSGSLSQSSATTEMKGTQLWAVAGASRANLIGMQWMVVANGHG